MDDSYYRQQAPFFGKWEIEEKLGEGASGKVYLIADRNGDQVFYAAMKAISIPPNDTELTSIMAEHQDERELVQYYQSMVKEVEVELELLARLKNSKNVTTYYEHEIREHKDGIGWDIFIRQERLTPLIDIMASRAFKEDEVIRLGIDICQALADCEEHRIVHRDIKPENIFADSEGTFKLGDFGIAKTLERTIVGFSKKGTYEYMAPEIYRKERGSASVDIYSLGLVLYKLLNENRGPFLPAYPDPIMFSDREKALSQRFKGAVITPPKNGSRALKAAVLNACEYDPAQRFKNASEFRDALLSAASCKDYDALPARLDVRRSKRRRRTAAAMLAGASVILFAWAAVSAMQVKDITGIDSDVRLYIGDSISPEYEISPSYLSERDIEFEMNGASASISDTGEITAVTPGSSTLVLSSGDFSKKVRIHVIPKVTSIICDSEVSLYEGSLLALNVALKPDKFSSEPIEFTSSDDSIVNVSDSGEVSGKRTGEATVQISAGGCSNVVKVNVLSRPLRKVAAKAAKKKRPSEGDGLGSFGDEEYF